MSDGHPWYGIIVFIVFVIINAILYGFGAAIQAVSENAIEEDADNGNSRAGKLLKLISNPAGLINSIHMATITMNMVAGVWIIGTISAGVSSVFWIPWLVAACMLIILSVFGIFIPRNLGTRNSSTWVYSLYPPVSFLLTLLSPITFVITKFTNGVLRLMGIDPFEEMENVTEEEIIDMVNEGQEQGVLLASEAEMITNIVELGDKEAQDIMTHRKNIISIDGNCTINQVFEIIVGESNSRFPVYDKDINNVIGILHFRDLVEMYADGYKRNYTLIDLKEEMLFKPHFIPETRNINALFKAMQSEKIHMAVVVDEYGQTTGIVTMEDILEEIVGNIMDEYDEEEEFIQYEENDSYVMDGVTALEDIEDLLDIEFDDEDFDTLNGFMTASLGRIPNKDDSFEVEYDGYIFSILQVENKMIKKVKVRPVLETVQP